MQLDKEVFFEAECNINVNKSFWARWCWLWMIMNESQQMTSSEWQLTCLWRQQLDTSICLTIEVQIKTELQSYFQVKKLIRTYYFDKYRLLPISTITFTLRGVTSVPSVNSLTSSPSKSTTCTFAEAGSTTSASSSLQPNALLGMYKYTIHFRS